jgi:hypothetical protein
MSTTTTAPAPVSTAATQRQVPRMGEHKGKVNLVTVVPSSTKPVIFTRIELDGTPTEQVVHSVRFANAQSIRIGLDEIRGAFVELIGKSDQEVIEALMTNTDSFIGRPVTVNIEPQLDKTTRAPVRGTNGQPYYNIRLRSALRNIEASTAKSVASAMLAATAGPAIPDDMFDEDHHQPSV